MRQTILPVSYLGTGGMGAEKLALTFEKLPLGCPLHGDGNDALFPGTKINVVLFTRVIDNIKNNMKIYSFPVLQN